MAGGRQGELTKAAKTTYLTMRAFPAAMVDARSKEEEGTLGTRVSRKNGAVV